MKKSLLKKLRFPEKELENMLTWLQKFCHKRGCQSHDLCPTVCCYDDTSDPALDLATAIAWLAADEVSALVEVIDAFNNDLYLMGKYLKNPFELKDLSGDLEDSYETIHIVYLRCDAYRDIVSYHYKRYGTLHRKLTRLNNITRDLSHYCYQTFTAIDKTVKEELKFAHNQMYGKGGNDGKTNSK